MAGIKVIRKFRNLFDVTFGTPSDGDVVTYDSATDKLVLTPSGSGGVTDHGALTGLADDDHPQYQLAATAATDAELAAAIAAHVAAGDPHPTYTTAAEVVTAILNAIASADGAGLTDDGSGVLSVNVDGVTIEIDGDALQVVSGVFATFVHTHAGEDIDSGTVADARIAASIARDTEVTAAIAAAFAAADGAGLSDNGSGVLSVNVDGTTIEISTDALRVAAASITAAHMDSGAATVGQIPTADGAGGVTYEDPPAGGAVDAEDVAFTPAGNLASTDVQAGMEELDAEKAALVHVHAGEDITSGTVADARIAATIARDSEVTAAIAAALAAADGAGLSDNGSGVLAVNVDDVTIEISTDSLRVKDGGITAAKVAADVATQAELDAVAAAKQDLDADLTAIAGLATDAAGRSILTLTDPGADRLVFWDESAGALAYLTAGTGLTITGTTIEADGGGGGADPDDASLIYHMELMA